MRSSGSMAGGAARGSFLTSVRVLCGCRLDAYPLLLLRVQDYLLVVLRLASSNALARGGQRLLSLWVEAAKLNNVHPQYYTADAMLSHVERFGVSFWTPAWDHPGRTSQLVQLTERAVTVDHRDLIVELSTRAPSCVALACCLRLAVESRNLPLCQWLDERRLGQVADVNITNKPASDGDLAMLLWLLDTPSVWVRDDRFSIISHDANHLAALITDDATDSEINGWLYAKGYGVGDFVDRVREACRTTSVSGLLVELRATAQTAKSLREAIAVASRHGHLHVVEVLVPRLGTITLSDGIWYSTAVARTVAQGHYAVAAWMVTAAGSTIPRGVMINCMAPTMRAAVEDGDLGMLQWLQDHELLDIDETLDAMDVSIARQRGHEDVVRYLATRVPSAERAAELGLLRQVE